MRRAKRSPGVRSRPSGDLAPTRPGQTIVLVRHLAGDAVAGAQGHRRRARQFVSGRRRTGGPPRAGTARAADGWPTSCERRGFGRDVVVLHFQNIGQPALADVSELECVVGYKPASPAAEGVRRFVEGCRGYDGRGSSVDGWHEGRVRRIGFVLRRKVRPVTGVSCHAWAAPYRGPGLAWVTLKSAFSGLLGGCRWIGPTASHVRCGCYPTKPFH